MNYFGLFNYICNLSLITY